ncbi:MAG: tetratricopeptide repeat protein [Bacteroidia bacterium]
MKKYLIIISLTIAAISCQSPKEKLADRIKELENSDSIFSAELMKELKENYIAFSKKYPDDERSASYLFKAAQRCLALNEPNEAVLLLNDLISTYKQNEILENAMFLLAFTYENSLNQIPQAEAAYKNFLQKFPDGELSEDAKIALQNLGKTPEEILKQSEK